MMELGNNTGILHGPNLIFHEAGHVLFGLFGNRLLTAFGGSLMETLVPLTFMVSFLGAGATCLVRRPCAGGRGRTWWDVAPYINDARMLQLTCWGGTRGARWRGTTGSSSSRTQLAGFRYLPEPGRAW